MSPSRFRILSANLANGLADPDAFAGLVEAVEPDVVAVQELSPAQAEALARVLPFGKLDPSLDHHGMGMALRAPGSVRPLRLPYRAAFVAELTGRGDDEPVEVLNVHLAAPHVRPVVQRMRDRRGQLRDILAYLDATPRRQRVLAGDLNATPLWPAYRGAMGGLGAASPDRPRPGAWPRRDGLARAAHPGQRPLGAGGRRGARSGFAILSLIVKDTTASNAASSKTARFVYDVHS
jgi:endonuclease/exonuclease/phosphatase family metal-dependent hydrolase